VKKEEAVDLQNSCSSKVGKEDAGSVKERGVNKIEGDMKPALGGGLLTENHGRQTKSCSEGENLARK